MSFNFSKPALSNAPLSQINEEMGPELTWLGYDITKQSLVKPTPRAKGKARPRSPLKRL